MGEYAAYRESVQAALSRLQHSHSMEEATSYNIIIIKLSNADQASGAAEGKQGHLLREARGRQHSEQPQCAAATCGLFRY